MKLTLRLRQQEALDAAKLRYDQGLRRMLIQLPTGVGKTPTFAALRDFFGFKKRVMVLVHKEELANQAADKLHKWNPDATIGVEMADRRSLPTDDFVVASVPTLTTNMNRLLQFNPEEFDVVVCDEAHHAAADTWQTVLGYFGFFDTPPTDRLLLGVTATPNRGDGKGLGQIFEELVYSYPIEDAVREGWLAEPIGWSVSTTTTLDEVGSTKYGDFSPGELAAVVDNPVRNALIVKAYLEYAPGRQFLAFTADIEHARHLAEEFNRNGVTTAAVWGIDKDRATKQAAHQNLEILGLTNCDTLTEGYDDWRISCVINSSPTESQLKFIQRIGRGLRIEEGVSNLLEARAAGVKLIKQNCIFIDVVDSTSKHSLASLPSVFGLPANLDLNGKSIMEALEIVQQHAANNPDIDFSSLTNLDEIAAYAEQVDLFTLRLPDSIMKASPYTWYRTPTGSYMLRLQYGGESLEVFKDLTGHWTAKGTVRKNHFVRGGFTNPEDGIRFADGMLAMLGQGLMGNLKRNSKINRALASATQWTFLKQMAHDGEFENFPKNLSHAEATQLIHKLMHKNVERARQRARNRTK